MNRKLTQLSKKKIWRRLSSNLIWRRSVIFFTHSLRRPLTLSAESASKLLTHLCATWFLPLSTWLALTWTRKLFSLTRKINALTQKKQCLPILHSVWCGLSVLICMILLVTLSLSSLREKLKSFSLSSPTVMSMSTVSKLQLMVTTVYSRSQNKLRSSTTTRKNLSSKFLCQPMIPSSISICSNNSCTTTTMCCWLVKLVLVSQLLPKTSWWKLTARKSILLLSTFLVRLPAGTCKMLSRAILTRNVRMSLLLKSEAPAKSSLSMILTCHNLKLTVRNLLVNCLDKLLIKTVSGM